MATHNETLVVDFDDTIALTLNRDWENAKPNTTLIGKLNDLYDQGWSIHIVTARGQLSCEGDSARADKKYRAQITSWLIDHGVKFTSLSFEKKLAAYYIDDKGITPEDFVDKFKREPLVGGLSGADIYYDKSTNAVFKDADNTPSVVEWFQFAKDNHFNTPLIHSVIGNTIKMEKLNEFRGDFESILHTAKRFSEIDRLHPGIASWRYVDRCLTRFRGHPEAMASLDFKLLEGILAYGADQAPQTFGHGDYSISNIMSYEDDDSSVVLIDPINDPTLLSSWVIDLAKLLMSLPDYDPRREQVIAFVKDVHPKLGGVLLAHEVGHLCRVWPYANKVGNGTQYLNMIVQKCNELNNQ